MYLEFGFVFIQDMVERALLEEIVATHGVCGGGGSSITVHTSMLMVRKEGMEGALGIIFSCLLFSTNLCPHIALFC